VTVSIRATTRAGLRPLRRAHRGYAAGRHVSSSQSESWRVSGPGRVGPDLCECARHGQWPGPSSAGAAAAASQRHGRASGSAVTGHEWPHADGAPVGAVLEPFVLLSLDLCVGPRPRGSARGRCQTGSRSRALQDRFAGPPPYLDFIAGRPFPFRCTLIAALLHSMLLTPSARRRRFVVFFLQPFRGRLCRGTPEPHPWPSGPAGRPGFRSCWGRAGPAFSVGAPVAGRTRAGPARSRLTLRARGIWGFRRWTWGGCGASRPWDAGLRPHCSHPAGSLTVCVSVHTVTAVAPHARASGPGRADGTTLRRRRARLAGSLMAPRRLAALGPRPPFCPEQCASQDLVRAVGLIAGRSRKRD